VRLVDPASLLYVELPLSGFAPADGIVVIGDAGEVAADVQDTVGVTDFPAGLAFAVQLLEASTVVDAVQAGGAAGPGEGDPASLEGDPRCFMRPAGIDTNEHLFDFVGNWVPSPGV
ncbi:MAG: hypothetical protein M0R80_27350, partial [Proteobacteria bacterium]|nr:hypothetical protein [Pseudomonadota bacterium]